MKRKEIPEYNVWKGMRARCERTTNADYPYYGGRGIRVCERWSNFLLFFADVGPRPTSQHTIDRYPNNDGNYEPGNVRWATRREQGRNKRNTRPLTYRGVTKPMSEWAEEFGLPYFTLRSRLDIYGWSLERALEEKYFEKKIVDSESITTKEAASLLNVTQRTIYDWINTGRLQVIKVRGLMRIPKSGIQA